MGGSQMVVLVPARIGGRVVPLLREIAEAMAYLCTDGGSKAVGGR